MSAQPIDAGPDSGLAQAVPAPWSLRGRRIPQLSPSTGILAAVAAWSLCLAIAAALGLGSGGPPLPDDPDLVEAVPALRLKQMTPPLGALDRYDEIASRPLLSLDRKPPAEEPDGEIETAVELAYTLTSVLITPGLSLAILRDANNQTARARLDEDIDKAPGWRLVELAPRHAVFEGPGGRKTLELRVFDGSGGEAPTIIASPSAAAQRAAVPGASVAPRLPAAVPTVVPPPPPVRVVSAAEQAASVRQRVEARRAELRRQTAQNQNNPEEPTQ